MLKTPIAIVENLYYKHTTMSDTSNSKLNPSHIWKQVCGQLEIDLSKGEFSTWILPSNLKKTEVNQNNQLECLIEVPTAFHLLNIKQRLENTLRTALEKTTHKNVKINFAVGSTLEEAKPSKQTTTHSPTVSDLFSQAQHQTLPSTPTSTITGLNPNHTFETYVVSGTNEMAHAAATAVSQHPGTAYKVLFLYGGVGVGKTHLMHAVGNNILKNNPSTSLLYKTGEEFMNEIVNALQTKKTLQMKQKYRGVKVLLIDDVQFIAGKTSMQEEFFHTFNAVVQSGGQIVLTSDRPPQEINPLQDRIKSRLEGGLIIDIQQPSLELRTAILLNKAQSLHFTLPMEFATFIAQNIQSTRRLEGVVQTLHSEHTLRNKPITQKLVTSIVSKEKEEQQQKITAKPLDVIKQTAKYFEIKLKDIKGPRRLKNIVGARHIAMYLLKHDLDMGLVEIGRHFGGRDHTTVLHAVGKIEEEIKNDAQLLGKVEKLRKLFI